MKVPVSFADSYEKEIATAGAVRELAGSRIRILCSNRQWLFEDRIKSVESALSKAETGVVTSLSEMLDLYAATVIVPQRSDVGGAVDALLSRFEASAKERNLDVTAFPYDDVHIAAQLGTTITPPVRPQVVLERRFEIQVRTGTMWSWWRATHDTIYKGGRRDWRTERVAAQARAALELTDSLLDDLGASASLQQARPVPGDARLERVAGLLQLWPVKHRPSDILRFGTTALAYMDASGAESADVEQHLRAFPALLDEKTELTPTQAIMVTAAQLSNMAHVGRIRNMGRLLLITPEMEHIHPPLAQIGAADRVRF